MKNVSNLIIDEYNDILVPKKNSKSIPIKLKKIIKSKSAISLTELTNSFKQKSIDIWYLVIINYNGYEYIILSLV